MFAVGTSLFEQTRASEAEALTSYTKVPRINFKIYQLKLNEIIHQAHRHRIHRFSQSIKSECFDNSSMSKVGLLSNKRNSLSLIGMAGKNLIYELLTFN